MKKPAASQACCRQAHTKKKACRRKVDHKKPRQAHTKKKVDHCYKAESRARKAERQQHIKNKNAGARARLAQRLDRSYDPRDAKLKKVAEQARNAARIGKEGLNEAKRVGVSAEKARQEAVGATSIAGQAMSEAAEATHQSAAAHAKTELNAERLMITAQRMMSLEEQVHEDRKVLQKVQTEAGEDRVVVQKVHTLAKHNQQRLDVDDRKRGYVTPPRWHPE